MNDLLSVCKYMTAIDLNRSVNVNRPQQRHTVTVVVEERFTTVWRAINNKLPVSAVIIMSHERATKEGVLMLTC